MSHLRDDCFLKLDCSNVIISYMSKEQNKDQTCNKYAKFLLIYLDYHYRVG